MWRELLRRFVRLGRDENGAALVTTLALLMFMYLVTAGVVAMGLATKDKIQLQNAADAASYSAAVVQADTLSRVATINRAMAWTYQSMVCRQMDYVVNKWLDGAKSRYQYDRKRSRFSNEIYAEIDYSKHLRITLRGSSPYSERWAQPKEEEVNLLDRKELEKAIQNDWTTIDAMNRAEKALLETLPSRMDVAARNIVRANLSDNLLDRTFCQVKMADKSKWQDGNLQRVLGDEDRFLSFLVSTNTSVAYHKASVAEFRNWFDVIGSASGIRRGFTRNLLATWSWKDDFGFWNRGSSTLSPDATDIYYWTQTACPHVLTERYFGAEGTVSVGLASRNENPWFRIFRRYRTLDTLGTGDRMKGLYAAFNPFKGVDWTWAFSSAKAAYKFKGEEWMPGNNNRAYRVDWNSGNWNLCVADWDAVFVPVRKACSNAEAKDGVWSADGVCQLRSWVTDIESWSPVGAVDSPYVVGAMPLLPLMHNDRGDIQNLDWSRLASMMYH